MLEFTLVVLLISALAAVLLNAIAGLRADVERAAVRQILNQMNAALAIRFSELYVRGNKPAIVDWQGKNALALVRGDERQDPDTADAGGEPAASEGDSDADPSAGVASGQEVETETTVGPAGPGDWSFEDGVITYRPEFPEALAGRADAVGRWEVALCGDAENPRGLRLRAIEPLIGYENNKTRGC